VHDKCSENKSMNILENRKSVSPLPGWFRGYI
jgi:hypothetical protein